MVQLPSRNPCPNPNLPPLRLDLSDTIVSPSHELYSQAMSALKAYWKQAINMTLEDQKEYIRLFEDGVYLTDGATQNNASNHVLYTELENRPNWATYVMLRSQYEHAQVKKLDANLIETFGTLDINDFTSDYNAHTTVQKETGKQAVQKATGKQATLRSLLGRAPERTNSLTLKRNNTGAVSTTTAPPKPKVPSASSTKATPSNPKTPSASLITTTPLKRKAASTLSINATPSKRKRPALDVQPLLSPNSASLSDLTATIASFPDSSAINSRILELVASLVETINEIKA
ncbi:hypothetical protein TARUN_5621 [Trichoderma arundinaceum]|uniref:Uncharacterized protein n=1 Tax=Trichoderma arundinaceum TaxID=490622 RepID=A0A395NKP8_TRIAR|nr:hypothetical protein TARUN_5621 [Trichoderma arundinaceum]